MFEMMDASFIISVLAMGGLGVFFAVLLAIAEKKFFVEEDPLVAKILASLPNTNCGACGYAGCAMLAEKLALKQVAINTCTAGGQSVAAAIAEILGVDSMKAERILAGVLCRGGEAEAVKNAVYRGDRTCSAANLTGGEKGCAYSCIGYGDCVSACNYEAMAMDSNRLPVGFFGTCVGGGGG